MGLMALREKQSDLAGTIASLTKDLESVRVKVKEATNEELMAQLEADRDTMNAALDAAKTELSETEEEIEEEEAKVKALADKGTKQMQKKKAAETIDVENYLASEQAMADFESVIRETAGEDREDVQKAWQESLATKGITNAELLLPKGVITAIEDAFENAGEIFAVFDHTGLVTYRSAMNTASGRARGHKKGNEKNERDITLKDKEVRAMFIFDYFKVDKETLKENQETGALMKYLMKEMPRALVAEIERAAVIGDGRADDDNYKIKTFEPVIKADAAYVTKKESSDDLMTDLVLLDAEITAEGDRYLFMSRQTLGKMKVAKNPVGQFLYPLGTDFAALLGVKKIFTPEWFTEENTDALAIEVVGKAYKLVGDKTIDSHENFVLAVNKHEFLQEIYSGGALMKPKSAGYLVAKKKGKKE